MIKSICGGTYADLISRKPRHSGISRNSGPAVPERLFLGLLLHRNRAPGCSEATKFGTAGAVNVYAFDDQAALSIKRFPEMTEE